MAARSKMRAVLVGNGSYGLYVGETDASDKKILADRAVRLANCRHVRYWYGRKGGITSLAAHGPCGPRQQESRIGAPCPSALIADVRTVFDLSPEAVANFAAVVA